MDSVDNPKVKRQFMPSDLRFCLICVLRRYPQESWVVVPDRGSNSAEGQITPFESNLDYPDPGESDRLIHRQQAHHNTRTTIPVLDNRRTIQVSQYRNHASPIFPTQPVGNLSHKPDGKGPHCRCFNKEQDGPTCLSKQVGAATSSRTVRAAC